MNRTACSLVSYLIGIAIGGVSTYIYMKRKADIDREEAIDQMREYYENREVTYDELVEAGKLVPENQENDTDISKGDNGEEIAKAYKTAPREEKLVRGTPARHVPIDYTRFYREDDPAESEHPQDDHEELQAIGASLTKEAANAKPRLIKREDFGSESHFNTMTLLYYTEDDVLTLDDDQNEELLQDLDEVSSMLGDALDKYGFRDNDESVIYVRNPNRGCDYEICKIFGSYYEAHP